jgi:uncharacterized protein YndB with AHSA1/START domain
MTNPPVEHRYELELTVPGTPEQVWEAIATANGIAAWMMPTELEPRVGGAVAFHMGPKPEDVSHGRVTAFEPSRRIVYEEDWATLVGHSGADVTPLATEFLVEATSGGTCVVRVVTSAFGTGADWEQEFFEEMANGWGPTLDTLRLYLTHFPGQHVSNLWAGTQFPGSPEQAIDAVRDALGVAGVGDSVRVRDVDGRVERSIPRHFLVRLSRPVPGFLSFFSYGSDEESSVHVQGHLFGDDRAADVEREQPQWQAWFDELGNAAAATRASA